MGIAISAVACLVEVLQELKVFQYLAQGFRTAFSFSLSRPASAVGGGGVNGVQPLFSS